nr:hypothetical protein [Gemmatimonadota bacterium]
MPYLAQRTGPSGEIIEEEIPTPEEQAAIDAANAAVVTGAGGGQSTPLPTPTPSSPSVDAAAAVSEVPAQTVQALYAPPPAAANPASESYAIQQTEQQGPTPLPEPGSYNYDAAEPYGVSSHAIHAGEDANRLRSQAVYSPPPLATIPEPPPRRDYNYAAAEPSLADRRLPMRDTAPIDPGQKVRHEIDTRGPYALTDNLARVIGLDPDDPNTDMANQLARNLYDFTGDRLGESAKGWAEMAGFAPEYLRRMAQPLRSVAARFPASDLLSAAGESWGTVEDIVGPHGVGLRQAQSTFDAPGAALAENVRDPLQEGLGRIDSPAYGEYETLRDRFGAEQATPKDLTDLINAPFLTLDGEAPPPTGLSANALGAGMG